MGFSSFVEGKTRVNSANDHCHQARRKAGRAGRPAWSILDYLETRDQAPGEELTDRRKNCIANNDGWSEVAFNATIDSFPNETLVYVDTDVESSKLDVTHFQVCCLHEIFTQYVGSVPRGEVND